MSLSIDAVSRALAEWAVGRHLELDESLALRYGDAGRSLWVAAVQTRLRYLAQALAVGRSEVFIESVSWNEVAFEARNGSPDDLGTSLRALREVLEEQVPDPAKSRAIEIIDASLASPGGFGAEAPESTESLDSAVLAYLEAALAADRPRAAGIIRAALEERADPRDLLIDVLQPAQIEIGRMWHHSEISVADEHAATAITESVMAMLRERVRPRTPNGRRVLTTAIGGELHSIGVRMVADFFEFEGWSVSHLGANTPREDVIEAVAAQALDVLAVSCTSTLFLRDLALLVESVRRDERTASTRVLVGGAPFNRIRNLWRDVGADGSAASAPEAVAAAEKLVAPGSSG